MADFFLTIDGMDGGSVSRNHKGAFTVNDFNFDISNLTAALGSGAATGKPVVAPLAVDIAKGSFMTGLLKAAATGQHIKSVSLQGDTLQGGTFYDLRLQDVTVSKITDSNGLDQLQLSFAKISIAERTQKSDGSLAPADIFSYDVKANTVSSTQLAAAKAGTLGGAGDPVDYFLDIPGLKGASTASKFKDDFEVGKFDFKILNTPVAFGSGGGQGKAAFSPLTVFLENGSPLNGLIKLAAQGKHLAVIDLKGANADQELVYDLKLSDVLVTKVNNGKSFEKVQFTFTKIQLTTWEQKNDGSLAAPETFTFNLKTNSAAKQAPAKIAADHMNFDGFGPATHDPDASLHHLNFGFAHGELLA